MIGLLTDLATACSLLTRLPSGWFVRSEAPPNLARSVWAFPVIGLIVGAIGGLVFTLASRLGMPPMLAGAWTLVTLVLVTGAFHEDGLADMADGLGGGRTRQRKLEIMRDSRIGTYGAIALLLSVMVRIAAMSAMARPDRVMIALALAGMLGRGGIVFLLLALPPARTDGMAASMHPVPRWSALTGIMLTIACTLVLLPGTAGLVICAVAFLASAVVTLMVRAQIGGQTGDVLGAAEIVVECAVLSALVCAV